MIIPDMVVNAIKAGRENVLFLAMSTLPYRMSTGCYYIRMSGGEVRYYNGQSQLEPGTKYYLDLLARENKRIDRIVIIGSCKSCVDPVPEAWRNAYSPEATAESVYEERIKGYILGKQTGSPGEKLASPDLTAWEKERPEEKNPEEICQSPFPGRELYRGTDLDKLFVCINPEDEHHAETYLWDIMKAILGEGSEGVNLYMDMQGGDRNALFEMNAVVELLEGRNVDVRARVATRYDAGNIINEVREVGDYYREIDLVTALRVFKRYGWGNELTDYFSRKQEERDREFTQVVKAASDAINLCDVDGFDRALVRIGSMVRDRKGKDGPKTKLDLIIEDFRKEYTDDLLDADTGKPMRYVEQIEWCLNKNFVQQALTILEAKMPTEYVRCGLRYYCDREEDAADIFSCLEAEYLRTSEEERYRFKDLNHYYIADYPFARAPFKGQLAEKCAYGVDRQGFASFRGKVKHSIETYRILRKERNKANHALPSGSGTGRSFAGYMAAKYSNDKNWRGGRVEGEELVRQMRDYLKEFRQLYEQTEPEMVRRVIDLG